VIELNELTNPDLIHPGDVILIPGVDGSPEQTHVVERGESLFRIAGAYGSSARAIAEANDLSNPDLILPGQELTIPAVRKKSPSTTSGSSGGDDAGDSAAGSSGRSGEFHIVQRGDTLESIADRYDGVSADDIAGANGILNGTVYTGTRLFLDGPAFVASGERGGSGSYVVQSGDRLGDIAAKHGTTISTLADLNGLDNVNLIRSGQTLTVPGGSSWVCPLEQGSYFNDWGFPRGGGRYHEGNDLFAPMGSPVRAPVSGTVELIRGSIGGLQVNLYGSDGIKYLGSHLDSAGKTGKVNAGDVIGYVGNSGNAAGATPHLHFGMYRDGIALNPIPSLVENGC
jgi:murein DD-endopeptidase MepM/ murein hydrolase activator NlpD